MPSITLELHNQRKSVIASMQLERRPFWEIWRDLADYILPSRYVWLQSKADTRLSRRNSNILDGTGTKAARTLASGMMNGITSPARPWFKLRLVGVDYDQYPEFAIWTDEVEKLMLQVMAESNFYSAMALLYVDLVVFGTATMMIYESPEKVIHCFNPALGPRHHVDAPGAFVELIGRVEGRRGHDEKLAADEHAVPLGEFGPGLGLQLVLSIRGDDALGVLVGTDGPQDNPRNEGRFAYTVA